MISIHAPKWGATWWIRPVEESEAFQSTHPRGVRRRTRWRRLFWQRYFNPRTHVGCDGSARTSSTSHIYFNPRTHVGCDSRTRSRSSRRPISIHAPTWGATLQFRGHRELDDISIHAPTWGATAPSASSIVRGAFQSTHPRGVRRYDDDGARRGFIFQSTHPRGVRHKNRARGGGDNPISIHAPTWGATRSKKRRLCARLHFNPRTHVGCDFICFSSSFFV